ncbi:hypothetical protein R6Q57_006213 [Mikania cordata]
MSKEEFLKIQTCTLKVNIHCDGCKRKVKKILQNIEGVYTVGVNSEHGTVTVSGNVDPSMLIKKLAKRGKLAHILVASKQNHHINDLIKNIQIKSYGKIKNHDPQQFQQLKGFQDLKLAPKLVDIKLPPVGVGGKDGHKSVKFKVSESGDDDSDDDEEEEDDDDDDDDEDELNDDDNDDDGDNGTDGYGDDDGDGDGDDFDDDDDDDAFDDDMDDIPVKKPTMVSGGGGSNDGGGMDLMGHISSIKRPESMTGNCNYQQRLKGATTNQQGGGNESFQPLMFSRLPPATSYIEPPYPPYSYPQAPHGELLTPCSSDENNTSSCNVM